MLHSFSIPTFRQYIPHSMKTKIYNYIFLLITCVCITLLCCKKTEPSPTSYTKQMAGNHKWVGTFRDFNSSVRDTVFEGIITVISDNAVRFEASAISPIRTLLYIDKKYKFNENIYAYFEISMAGTEVTTRTDTLKYNYVNNTISYYARKRINNNSKILDVYTP